MLSAVPQPSKQRKTRPQLDRENACARASGGAKRDSICWSGLFIKRTAAPSSLRESSLPSGTSSEIYDYFGVCLADERGTTTLAIPSIQGTSASLNHRRNDQPGSAGLVV